MFLVNLSKRIPFTPLQVAMHLYAWSAMVMMIFDLFTHHLTANPIQQLELRTGRHAIALLILSLVCTPLYTLFGWREPLKRSRALGLYALMYASVHVIIFMDLDYGLAWSLLIQTVVQKSYILFGMTTFLLLLPLAITSFDIWKVRLGKNWKRLHRVVYFTAPIACLHYALAVKGDIFHLSGDINQPLMYAALILVLLLLRVPFIRKFFASLRNRIRIRRPFSKPNPEPKGISINS
jgi:methionine sulfoxide reductase heme-binding subunit